MVTGPPRRPDGGHRAAQDRARRLPGRAAR
jgi:hypothetical protein